MDWQSAARANRPMPGVQVAIPSVAGRAVSYWYAPCPAWRESTVAMLLVCLCCMNTHCDKGSPSTEAAAMRLRMASCDIPSGERLTLPKGNAEMRPASVTT